MEGAGRMAAIVLAAVLGWAALAKVRHRQATVASFRGLGLPAPAALGVCIPLAEVAVAAGLLVRPAAAAWPALGLVAAFTLVLGRVLASGMEVGCACFGAPADRPVSGWDLVRNAALAALAVMATGAGPGWVLSPLL